jgi:membrane-associated phospholipid phosphatase
MTLRLKDLSLFDQLLVAASLIAFGFLLIDPFVFEQARALPPDVKKFFANITNIGRSNWMLIPTGAAIALALVLKQRHASFRNSAAYGLIASTIGFVFVSIGGAGLITSLIKNILGRARPKLFDTVGALDFKLFAFSPEHASFPSGHATNIFAFATVIAMLWPQGRVLLYTVAVWIAASRVLIGAHYFTDVVVAALIGTAFPYIVRERFAARRWLFERTRTGGYRIRGLRTQRWLNWPGAHERLARTRPSGHVRASPGGEEERGWDWS